MKTIHSFAHSQMVPSVVTLYQYFSLDTQWKSFKSCYLTLIILFDTIHSLAHSQIRGIYDKFPDFFRMDTFIYSTHMKF